MERPVTQFGLTFSVVAPPSYQRWIDAAVNVVFVPMSWLALLDLQPGAGRRHSQYRVEVCNPNGQRRSLALGDTLERAIERRDQVLARLVAVGLDAWIREVPISRDFFDEPGVDRPAGSTVPAMGLREVFVRMLSRGSAPERDPGAMRELMTVQSFQAPLLVARLAEHGIEATAEDSFNLIGALSEVRILVRDADFETAQAVSET